MKFKAGDKVWVNCLNEEHNVRGIKAGVIIGPAKLSPTLLLIYYNFNTSQWYEVELVGIPHPSGTTQWVQTEDRMWPRDEDGRQVGDWEHSVTYYKPNEEKERERTAVAESEQ